MLSSLQSEKKRRELNEKLIKSALILAAAISILTTFGILFSILFEAIEFFQLRSFWYFLTGTIWSPGVANSQFGALPIFAGTFVITIIALLVAIPIGLGSAIYMSEYASPKLRDYLKPIFAMTTKVASQRTMALYRNVHPLHLDTSNDRDTALEQAENRIKKLGIVGSGDKIVLTVGEPMGQVGGTNTLKIVDVK